MLELPQAVQNTPPLNESRRISAGHVSPDCMRIIEMKIFRQTTWSTHNYFIVQQSPHFAALVVALNNRAVVSIWYTWWKEVGVRCCFSMIVLKRCLPTIARTLKYLKGPSRSVPIVVCITLPEPNKVDTSRTFTVSHPEFKQKDFGMYHLFIFSLAHL